MTDAFQWYRWLEAVNERPDIRPATVRIAVQLARRADNNTGRCYPGWEWLTEKSSVSRRAMTYAIADLRRIGALEVIRPGTWRRRAEYQLVAVEKWDAVVSTGVRTTPEAVVSTNRHVQCAQIDTHSAHACAHLTTEELTKRTFPPPPAAAAVRRARARGAAATDKAEPAAEQQEQPDNSAEQKAGVVEDGNTSGESNVNDGHDGAVASEAYARARERSRVQALEAQGRLRPLDPTKALPPGLEP